MSIWKKMDTILRSSAEHIVLLHLWLFEFSVVLTLYNIGVLGICWNVVFSI